MLTPRKTAAAGVEKHDECLARFGECPHWLIRREPQVAVARIHGLSVFEFGHRDSTMPDYLDALEGALQEADLADRRRRRLEDAVDEQRAQHRVQVASSADDLLSIIESEQDRDGDPRTRVIAAASRRLDRLRE